MEAWATSTVEEAAPAFLSENPQERELARGALWMDAGLWSIGALADAGPATKLAKLLPDAPEVGGVRAAAREAGEGIASLPPGKPTPPGNPLPPDFIDNLADRPGSFNPNVAKTKLLDAARKTIRFCSAHTWAGSRSRPSTALKSRCRDTGCGREAQVTRSFRKIPG